MASSGGPGGMPDPRRHPPLRGWARRAPGRVAPVILPAVSLVLTAHATLLRVDAEGLLCHGPQGAAARLHAVPGLPGVAVLEGGRPLRVAGLARPARLLALRWEAAGEGVTLAAPGGRPLLCAEPAGRVVLNRAEPGPWEAFALRPLPGTLPPARPPAALAALAALLARPEEVAARLEAPAGLPSGLAELLAALLPPSGAARLAAALAWRPAARAALARADGGGAPDETWDEAWGGEGGRPGDATGDDGLGSGPGSDARGAPGGPGIAPQGGPEDGAGRGSPRAVGARDRTRDGIGASRGQPLPEGATTDRVPGRGGSSGSAPEVRASDGRGSDGRAPVSGVEAAAVPGAGPGGAPAEDAVLGEPFREAAPWPDRSADPWAEALPMLGAWLLDRDRRPPVRSLGPRHDVLAAQDAEPRSLPQRVAGAARAAVVPRRTLCLLAAARDEGPYLVEWLAHHRCLGAEHAFLYGNGNDDGSDALLAALHASGVVTWLRNEGGDDAAGRSPVARASPQYRAYGHALGLLPEILDFRWAAILDCDEFVGLDTRRHPDLPHLLAWQEERARAEGRGVDAVSLCWVTHGSGGAVRPDGRGVLARFPLAEGPGAHVKSVVRPRRFLTSQAHYPIAPAGERRVHRGADGEAHPDSPVGNAAAFSPAPTDGRAWIAHHVWKSAEEYAWRRSRNTGDQPARAGSALALDRGRLIGFLEQHGDAGMRLDERVPRCTPGLGAEMARLRALPGVAAAEAACVAAYRAQVAAMVRQMRGSPAFRVPGSPEGLLLRLLDGG